MPLRYLALAASLAGPLDPPDTDNQPFWTGHPDAAAFERALEGRLTRARGLLGRLVAVTGRRTIPNTLAPYDHLMRELDRAAAEAGLIRNVHPDSALRQAAEHADQRVSALATEISIDRRVFEAIGALALEEADPVTRHYVSRILRDFRLAGVDKDSATRAKIKALREELVVIGQEFDHNIREDVREVDVEPAGLEGLPADFIAAHPPGPGGRVRLTTEHPDVLPVLTYARSDELRRRLRGEFDNRAYPRNMAVLDRLIARRDELARLLGFDSWADYALADKIGGLGGERVRFHRPRGGSLEGCGGAGLPDPASFTHLNGYSAFYYTYMWSLVLAKDLFSRFDRADLLAPEPARRYRQLILERGGSAPAARLVRDFLGRPFSFDAWRSWLEAGS